MPTSRVNRISAQTALYLINKLNQEKKMDQLAFVVTIQATTFALITTHSGKNEALKILKKNTKLFARDRRAQWDGELA